MFRATIGVTLKESILDPQGQTTLRALGSLGFQEATNLRIGKYYVITLNSANEAEARKKIDEMCEKLLVNPVIEKYALVDLENLRSATNHP